MGTLNPTHSLTHSFVVSIRISENESSVNRATDLCKLVSIASQPTGGARTPERHAPTASGWTRGPAAAAFERLPSRSILHSATRPDPRQPGHPPRRRRTAGGRVRRDDFARRTITERRRGDNVGCPGMPVVRRNGHLFGYDSTSIRRPFDDRSMNIRLRSINPRR